MTQRRMWLLMLALAWIVAPLRAGAQAPQAAPPVEKSQALRNAERELWEPGSARFIRSWSIRPAAAPLADEAGLDGPGEGWIPYVSWTDVGEVSGQAGPAGTATAPRYAYALAVIVRDQAGPAEVAVASNGPAKVWVNGQAVGDGGPAAAYTRDAPRLPVVLKAGANRLLVRLENRGGPWFLAARVLNPNQPVAAAAVLSPVVSEGQGTLSVRTDLRALPAPVSVAVLAPGGRVVASQEVGRGETASFQSAGWPDGPYEVRLATQDSFGKPVLAFVAWYKGDLAAGARRLLARAAAERGDDARAGHWRMLGDLVRDRAGADLSRVQGAAEPVQAALMEAAELDLGPAGAVHGSGLVRLDWIDPVDGSVQFCRAYLPSGYDPARRWPTVINLHGFNPPNPPYVQFWGVDQRHEPTADRWGVIWIDAHGRANSQYIGIGEKDVLRCLEEARARLKVDDERTYLTGESMGGSGTWLIGSRFADRFAAIAPVYGGWDYRLQPGMGFDNPAADRPMERWLAEAHSSFVSAEQLINTPVFVTHGDSDRSVDVRFSRHIVERLQRWNYDVRYREIPGMGHEDLQQRDEVVGWLLQHARVHAPRHVKVRSTDLAAARNGWLAVEAATAPLALIEADAEVTERGTVRLDTRNAARLSLDLPSELIVPGQPVEVIWNGQAHRLQPDGSGRVTLAAADAPDAATAKRARLSGGLSDAFATPFAIVVGTSARDPEMRRMVRAKAERLATLWTQWQHVTPRMVDDTALTAGQQAGLTLVLIGGPDANLVTRRLGAKLPLKLEAGAVSIDGRRFPARDAVVQMVRPSPWAKDRYVLVAAGTSAEGMYLWNPGGFWNQVLGFQTNPYDWTLADGRMAAIAPGLMAERGWIASGVFDEDWRRDDQLTFLGDPALRDKASTRRMPSPHAVPAAALDRYAGRYELFPGVALGFRRDGETLTLTAPGGSPQPLTAVSDVLFTDQDGLATLEFRLSADGAVSEVLATDAQQNQTHWRRTP